MRQMLYSTLLLFIILVFLPSCVVAEWPKIYKSSTQEWVSVETLKQDMQQAQAVFVGEQHNHVWGHQVELMLLEWLFEAKPDVAVAMEMFERDVQHLMDGYLNDQMTEQFFTKHSRPWPGYENDYRPLVEFAKSFRLPVLAMNIPRRYASFVAHDQESILWHLPAHERTFFAQEIVADETDKYYEKFEKTMKGHVPKEKIRLYYRSQCLKDDTMAMSMEQHLQKSPSTTIIAYAGAFHTDEYLGIPQKLKAKMPSVSQLTVTIVPVPDGTIDPKQHADLADYILFAPENPERPR